MGKQQQVELLPLLLILTHCSVNIIPHLLCLKRVLHCEADSVGDFLSSLAYT